MIEYNFGKYKIKTSLFYWMYLVVIVIICYDLLPRKPLMGFASIAALSSVWVFIHNMPLEIMVIKK